MTNIQGVYLNWANLNNFQSMLLRDTEKQCKEAAEASKKQQTQMGEHFTVATPQDKLEKYTDEGFKTAAIEWVITTNQVWFFNCAVT